MPKVDYEFTIYGNPRGKGRPRFVGGHAYTDNATAAYEKMVRAVLKGKGFKRLDKQPTMAFIQAFFPVPKSLSKKKRDELFGTRFTKKPDADNIAKIILDACSDLWEDDSQVDCLGVQKYYVGSDDEKPRVNVKIFGVVSNDD